MKDLYSFVLRIILIYFFISFFTFAASYNKFEKNGEDAVLKGLTWPIVAYLYATRY